MTNSVLKDLQRIPGIGPSLAADLLSLGVNSVAGLKGKDPEQLYQQLSQQVGKPVDRCVLYVFRCAIYFAEHAANKTPPDPELLKWWNWKDRP